jgi:hypothetical protein
LAKGPEPSEPVLLLSPALAQALAERIDQSVHSSMRSTVSENKTVRCREAMSQPDTVGAKSGARPLA